jgi:two-component system NtrC family sensor kinase
MTETPNDAATNPQQIIAELQRKLAERTAERDEALAHQTATADILEVIASSPSDVQPVFEAIATSANRLIGGLSTMVYSLIDDMQHLSAFTPTNPAADAALQELFPRPLSMQTWPEQTRNGQIVHVPDIEADSAVPEKWLDVWRLRGFRSFVRVPLRRDRMTVGVISVTRAEPGPFAAHHIQLLQTFADQAVIAIENARLFNETQEALERQTATAEILKVIASSPSDVQPVFDAIATSSKWLVGAFSAVVFRFVDGVAHVVAFTPTSPAADQLLKASFPRPVAEFPPFERAHAGGVVQVPDTEAEPDERMKQLARARGFRSVLNAPLMSKETPLGMITVTRKDPGPFADHHVQLLQTFADQAVIAIENVRLFDEVQTRTRDLSEALTYQTGSSNILSVIASSPTDVGPVLQAIVESACELCEAYDAAVFLKDGGDLHPSAHHGPIPMAPEKLPIGRNWTAGRAFLDRKPVHVHDFLSAEGDDFPVGRERARRLGFRSVLSVPLLREGGSIGTIVLRRTEVHPFSDKQIALLQTFADQAVIAIGNVRLFDEVQAKTRDLSESLEQQTATSEVLKAISASSGELEPVFQAMLENAVHLCGAKFAMLYLYEDNEFRAVGKLNLPPAWEEFLGKNAIRANNPRIPMGRVALTHQPVHVEDVLTDPAYIEGYPGMVGVAELGGARTLLQVPMLKDNELVGTIGIYRQEVRPFTDKQIALVQSFAAQAVIAVENARLLNELRQRTDDLTESLNDLRTAQDRLVQTEKLASLGQLTAGIAHEIKNPLNFVNNFSGISVELVDELKEGFKAVALDDDQRADFDELTETLRINLQKVVQHGKRADAIVKNMLLHSRQGSGEHRRVEINALVEDGLNLAFHGARAEKQGFEITLERFFDPNAGEADLFAQEITRVLLNLLSNGFYATTKRKADAGDGFEAVLSATTKNLGDKVEIRIRDNGTGIPEGVKEKIFNPFFTTKPSGEGTGLGLSISHDIIVKQHGGSIEVETEPGVFTEFKIVLPRTGHR